MYKVGTLVEIELEYYNKKINHVTMITKREMTFDELAEEIRMQASELLMVRRYRFSIGNMTGRWHNN